MADQIKKLSAGHSIEVLDAIMTEVEEARGEYESLDARLDEISGEGYSKAEVDALLALKQNALNSAQLAAANSGIDSEKVEQIESNKNNILLLEQMNGKKNRFSTTLDKIKSANKSAVWSVNSTTINGVTYTVNEDLTIKAVSNGTNTLSVLYLGQLTDVTTSDIITGCPKNSGASATTFEFRIYNEGRTAIGGDTGSGWIPTSNRAVELGILIRANQTVDLTFTPMICEKTMHDAFPDYQPYAMSNAELTAAIQALQAQLNQ